MIRLLLIQSEFYKGLMPEDKPEKMQFAFTGICSLTTIHYFCSLKTAYPLNPAKPSMIPKPLWVVLGFFFTGIGIIGYIVPLMPGLVFFILAAFCFAKGSRRFLKALLSNKYVGPAIMDWKKGRGMTVKSKVIAIATVMPSMAFSAFYIVHIEWVRWCIVGCAVLVAVIIISVKTKRSK